ncbi:YCL044C [Saccharomyces arboricola H-6]|uniref:YCL044C n=1 Tax=Saccharomyces arboricola (strain H-6 / AS 2.3317 / CBS 10644) TaxID=1160507 RepID=J8Q7B9_SACAR|nr:YCL044C [Saccharomyces arboricola H-6]
MAVLTPPSDTNGSTDHPRSCDHDKDDNDIKKFYVRPSLGLKLWGPLVPAPDNLSGLYTLISIQSAVGLFALWRLRRLYKLPPPRRIATHTRSDLSFGELPSEMIVNGKTKMKKDIADFPTLNRFSVTHGDIVLAPPPIIPRQSRFITVRKLIWGLFGSLLLSQSLLELTRLNFLKYDPWYDEMKSVRDKKFFNNIVKYYHEGIDPTKIKVKDAMNGTPLSTNIPEVKQSVALARAQVEAQNPIIKWFGPLEYKPMSFNEYLNRMEFHLDMFEFFQNKRNIRENSIELINSISHHPHSSADLEDLSESKKLHLQNVEKRLHFLASSRDSIPTPVKKRSNTVLSRGVILPHETNAPQDIDLDTITSLYDPWMTLALETSLSIKFIPTTMPSRTTTPTGMDPPAPGPTPNALTNEKTH